MPNHHITAANIFALHEGARVVDYLQNHGLQVIVLKGAALTETVYAIDERAMADFDILIRGRDKQRVTHLLRDAGVERVDNPNRPIGGLVHFAGAYMTPEGVAVDVHTHLAQQGRWPIDHHGLFERSVRIDVAGVESRRLSNEDSLLYLAINQAKDEFATDARTAEDVRRVVDALGVDWPLVTRRASEWGCEAVLWLTLRHAQAIAGLDVPRSVESRLRPARWRQRYLGSMIDVATIPPYRFACHHPRVRQLLLSPALTENPVRFARTTARFVVLRGMDWAVARVRGLRGALK